MSDFHARARAHRDALIARNAAQEATDGPAAPTMGGLIEGGPLIHLRVEPVGTCPNGHAQYRINGSPHVEHIVNREHLDDTFCPYAVQYQPEQP